MRIIARWRGLTIARIFAEFVAHARSYYSSSNEFENFRQAMSPLKRLYAATIASEFGPRALAAILRKRSHTLHEKLVQVTAKKIIKNRTRSRSGVRRSSASLSTR